MRPGNESGPPPQEAATEHNTDAASVNVGDEVSRRPRAWRGHRYFIEHRKACFELDRLLADMYPAGSDQR